ncbi:dTDP-4-amino-4,6-dideoxygalactose transaminase [Novosphingobium sp. PhB165]|uniref:DegT/DnrJ/EryC1/StrS family aminotransferase n=1 Tax=Novosphingobium sp. PhB165 TaxID=2485105 RepID=UPI0010467C0A|nr:DegT/DnrJ/EryC1/StrS family aminotransferase [Novosphingobium sp. PhB165]TCM21374.1 dTDP-4-amino-4,6-dideoxygalactose transaminase [Novosphingobium sp. PhB165]
MTPVSTSAVAPAEPGLCERAPLRSQWPRHEPDEIEAVADVLRSGKVNALVHGEENRAFAAEFAGYIGEGTDRTLEGLCIANGTLTLEVALRALGIGPGDEVIVPARSFFASASCVMSVGALPVFADIDPVSQNIDPDSVERMIGTATRAVICVHLAGWPCDMEALGAICARHDLRLIEDCAQAHGAAWRGARVGSFGDAASFSFCTDKIMSTGGEGGLLLFRDHEAWLRGWAIKDHGKDYRKVTGGNAGGTPGAFRHVHDHLGSNYRMTEMQAALGRRQLAKLPLWLAARARNARLLREALADLPGVTLPEPPSEARHAWYKFYVQLSGDAPEARRNRVLRRLLELGLPAATGSCPDMSREAALAGQPVRRDGTLEQAVRLGERTLMFPVDHTLGDEGMARMAGGLRTAMQEPMA